MMGMRLDEALELARSRVLSGGTAVFSNSAYCIRLFQEHAPLEFIVATNPLYPIAIASGLSTTLLVRLEQDGADCTMIHTGDLWGFEWLIKELKGRVDRMLMRHDTDINFVNDIEGALNTLTQWVGRGTVIMLAEGYGCLWPVQEVTSPRVLVVKKPFFIIGVANVEDVARALGTHLTGPIELLITESRGALCVSSRFVYPSLTEVIGALNTLLRIQGPIAQLTIQTAFEAN